MATIGKLKPEFIPGSRIEECAEDAVWLYKKLNCPIQFNFNGFNLLVGAKHRQQTTAEEIMLLYEQWCKMTLVERVEFEKDERAKSWGYKSHKDIPDLRKK